MIVSEQQRLRNLERYQKINRELQAARERIAELEAENKRLHEQVRRLMIFWRTVRNSQIDAAADEIEEEQG